MDIWTEELERRHLPVLQPWLSRGDGAITPNDLLIDGKDLESWFAALSSEPGRQDFLALVYETPVGIAGLRRSAGGNNMMEMYLLLGEIGYNLLRTATYVTLRVLDRAFSDAGVGRTAIRIRPGYGWFLPVLEQMGFSRTVAENGILSFSAERNEYLSRKYLF